jgi:arsenate reductase
MAQGSYTVLFLCTGNSARSILAEAIMNHVGQGRFRAFSAGSFPKGTVHPYALDLLASLQIPAADARSKSWDEFATPTAPAMNFVITVCDQAAGEVCPIWPGNPVTAHWGMPDPAAVDGSELDRRAAFRSAFAALERRIKIFTNLRGEALDRMARQRARSTDRDHGSA